MSTDDITEPVGEYLDPSIATARRSVDARGDALMACKDALTAANARTAEYVRLYNELAGAHRSLLAERDMLRRCLNQYEIGADEFGGAAS